MTSPIKNYGIPDVFQQKPKENIKENLQKGYLQRRDVTELIQKIKFNSTLSVEQDENNTLIWKIDNNIVDTVKPTKTTPFWVQRIIHWFRSFNEGYNKKLDAKIEKISSAFQMMETKKEIENIRKEIESCESQIKQTEENLFEINEFLLKNQNNLDNLQNKLDDLQNNKSKSKQGILETFIGYFSDTKNDSKKEDNLILSDEINILNNEINCRKEIKNKYKKSQLKLSTIIQEQKIQLKDLKQKIQQLDPDIVFPEDAPNVEIKEKSLLKDNLNKIDLSKLNLFRSDENTPPPPPLFLFKDADTYQKVVCPLLQTTALITTETPKEAQTLFKKWEGHTNLIADEIKTANEPPANELPSSSIETSLYPLVYTSLSLFSQMGFSSSRLLDNLSNLKFSNNPPKLRKNEDETYLILEGFIQNPTQPLFHLFTDESNIKSWPKDCQFLTALLILTIKKAIPTLKQNNQLEDIKTKLTYIKTSLKIANNPFVLSSFVKSTIISKVKEAIDRFDNAPDLNIAGPYKNFSKVFLADMLKMLQNIDADKFTKITAPVETIIDGILAAISATDTSKSEAQIVLGMLELMQTLSLLSSKNPNIRAIAESIDTKILPNIKESQPLDLEKTPFLAWLQTILPQVIPDEKID